MSEIVQEKRRIPQGEVNQRIARFLEQEAAFEKAERKETRKAILQPLGFFGAAVAVLGTSFSIYMPIINASSAKGAAVAVEEWSASHPTKEIPVTNEFISYPTYLKSLSFNESETRASVISPLQNPANIMIKVVDDKSHGSTVGYTVCTYLTSNGNGKMDTYSSSTGKPAENSLKACS